MPDPSPLRVAVLLDQIESDYHLEIIGGIRKVCARVGARVMVVAGGPLGAEDNQEVRNFVYSHLPLADIDGVIVLSGCLSNHSGTAVLPGFLAPLLDRPLITIGVAVPGIASVMVDNGFGVRKLVAHLLDKHGVSKVAFLMGPEGSLESEARVAGYSAALEAHGLESNERLRVHCGLTREDGVRGISLLLEERGFRPATLDAVVCFNDDVALGVIEELHRRNIGVPQPVSVLGFDDVPSAQVANPPLTTVNQRAREQGETAARAILAAISEGTQPQSDAVDTQLVVRESCGCRIRLQNDSRHVDSERPRVARTCRLALIERRTAIRAQLSRAAEGRMAGSHDWEGRLIDALAAQIDSEEGGAFLWEFERLARLHQRSGGDVLVCHDVLSALRLQALPCAEVQPLVRPYLEDVFQESRVLLARVAAAITREHLDGLNLRLRAMIRVCLQQVGNPDLTAVARMLDQELPQLGVQSYCISRFSAVDQGQLEVVASKSTGLRSQAPLELPVASLGLDPHLDRLGTVVVEPLTYLGRPIGVAAFSWGAAEPAVYEELRDLLGMVLHVGAALPPAEPSQRGIQPRG